MIDAGKKAQAYYEGKADAVNERGDQGLPDHKVKVVTLSDADYDAWLDVAQEEHAMPRFAKDVPNGQKLIDEALVGQVTRQSGSALDAVHRARSALLSRSCAEWRAAAADRARACW